jgi:hypothetical protein
MKIGFTGTRNGMTLLQKQTVLNIINNFYKNNDIIQEVHIGDCIGADYDFYKIISNFCFSTKNKILLIGHIPDNNFKRAFCAYDIEKFPKSYLNRNRDIVDESDILISTPNEYIEQLRSGTWATIRYAKKQNKKIIIIYPSGTIEKIN